MGCAIPSLMSCSFLLYLFSQFCLFMKALVPKLKEPDINPGIMTSILAALGELAGVWVSTIVGGDNEL